MFHMRSHKSMPACSIAAVRWPQLMYLNAPAYTSDETTHEGMNFLATRGTSQLGFGIWHWCTSETPVKWFHRTTGEISVHRCTIFWKNLGIFSKNCVILVSELPKMPEVLLSVWFWIEYRFLNAKGAYPEVPIFSIGRAIHTFMLNLNKLITRTECQECCSDVQAINFKFFKPLRCSNIKNFTGEIFLHWCTGGVVKSSNTEP